MRQRLRVVWDTNVFISTFLIYGRSSSLADAVFKDKLLLLVSEDILKEYFDVAIRPKFGRTIYEVKRLLLKLRQWSEIIPIKTSADIKLKDLSDQKFLDCAINGRASYIISGDKDFLSLEAYKGVKIVSISTFIRII